MRKIGKSDISTKPTNYYNNMNGDKIYEQGRELLILGLKVSKPDITEEQAEAIIVNVGNYIQLKRLGEST